MKKAEITESKAKKLSIIFMVLLVFIMLILLLNIFLKERSYSAVTYSFSTFVNQTIYGDNAEETAKEAADIAANIEDILSFDGENSEIAKINENAGDKWTSLSSLTFSVLEKAKSLSELTNGDFDISIAPVSRLYRFKNNEFTPPSDELIKEYAEYVDFTELRLNEDEKSASFAHFGYALDIDSIIMAAACDAINEKYISSGIKSAAVVIGDNIAVTGSKPDGKKWEIIVNTPDNEDELGIISIEKGFVSTVSKYENYVLSEGKEYHSIIDPKTGYPVENNLESVTVIGNSTVESAAIAYALFVKGYNDSQSLLKETDAFAIFVFDDNTVRIFGETGVFTLTNENYKMR